MSAGIFSRFIFNNAIFNTGSGEIVSVTCEYLFTNFEDSSIGDAPPVGWTARGPSGYQTLAVANDSPPFKRRVATLSSEDGATVAFSIDAYDAFTTDRAEADIVVCVHRDGTNDHERVAVHVRGQGSGTITAGYEFGIDFLNQRIRIYKRVAGVVTTPFPDLSISHPLDAYRLYRFRASGSATTELKARIWAPGATEPTTWGLSESDSSSPITAAGWIGFGGYVPSGIGESKLNFFSAASGGCSAYVPVLNDAFLAWLDLPRQRCVLAEMMATGYDSAGSPDATKTVHAYISNMGFTSKSTDDPPNQHYDVWLRKVPTFHREMSVALSGKATAGIGSIVVKNPARTLTEGGVRDNWARMKWKRDFVKLWIGDVTWRKSDFRPFVVGQLGQPIARKDEIEFQITDLLGLLDRPLQTNRFASGPREGQLKPILAGTVMWMEPVPTSSSTLEHMIHDGSMFADVDLWDDGVSLAGIDSVDSADAGTDTLQVIGHGLSTDARVRFQISAPPGLSTGIFYYVLVVDADHFQVSLTRGGTPENITGPSSGELFLTRNWWIDLATSTLTPAAPPVGRLMARGVAQQSTAGDACKLASVLDELIFERFGLSRDFKDTEAFDELLDDLPNLVGYVFYDNQNMTALAAMETLCKGANAWYGVTPDGLIQAGRVQLPEATATMSFAMRDVRAGSLVLERRILPANRETMAVRTERQHYLNGPLNLSPDRDYQILRPYVPITSSGWGAGGTPLDDHPDVADVVDLPPMESVFALSSESPNEIDRLEELYAKTLGVFSFQTRLRAYTLNLGDTIELRHGRLGWREWDIYDPASPDNPADTDSTKAVVIGIDVNLESRDGFPVKVTVVRPIPGYYPEENVTS